jgi:hypothetical protein
MNQPTQRWVFKEAFLGQKVKSSGREAADQNRIEIALMVGANQSGSFFRQPVESGLPDSKHHLAADPGKILDCPVSKLLKPAQLPRAGVGLGIIHCSTSPWNHSLLNFSKDFCSRFYRKVH